MKAVNVFRKDLKREPLGVSPTQHVDLLPQDQNLCLKLRSRPKQVDSHSIDQSAQI
jgi:hypothetical protein